MKRLNKLILVIVLLFTFTISVFADEADYDFSVSDKTYTLDEVEELKLSHKARAEEFNNNLDSCKKLSYKTDVVEGSEKFDTITAERAAEKDAVVHEKEDEGYTVVVVEKKHGPAVVEYAFNVLNGEIVSGTKNGNNTNGYNRKKVDQVIQSDEFTDYEDEDVQIVNTVDVQMTDISGSQTAPTMLFARSVERNLLNQGYKTNIVQNNTERTTFEFTSNRVLSNFEGNLNAYNRAVLANPGKEILDLRFDNNSPQTITNGTDFDNLSVANARARALRISGQYASVSVDTVVNENEKTKTVAKGEFNWPDTSNLTPYSVDLYTGNIKTGYRDYYNEEIVVQEAQEETNRYEHNDQCRVARRQYASNGWTVGNCERVNVNYNQHYYTLTVTKPAVTRVQGYYDEYEFAKSYKVTTRHYLYTGSYVATDYTVSYTGNRGTVSIRKEAFDKYYEIDGSRDPYTVNTTGTIEDDNSCTTSVSKTIDTGVSENLYYEILLLIASIGLVVAIKYRKRHN